MVKVLLVEVVTNGGGGFVAVHERHITIDEDQVVIAELVLVLFYVFLDCLQSLATVVSVVTNVTNWQFEAVKHHNFDSLDIELLVVNKQNFLQVQSLCAFKDLHRRVLIEI